jgi:hypothetical protein
MRLALIHAVLLVLAMGFAYQTWTRELRTPGAPGSILLWEARAEDVEAIRYESPAMRFTVERREDAAGEYYWGTVTRTPEAPAVTPADSAATDSAAISPPPVPPAPQSSSFVLGQDGQSLVSVAASPRALRDLEIPSEEQLREFGLENPTTRLAVDLGGNTRELTIGEAPWGTGDRYALETSTGRVYVLDGELIRYLDRPEENLPERGLHVFDANRVRTVVLGDGTAERPMRRGETPAGANEPNWSAPETPEQPDATFMSFMTRVGQLWVVEYTPDVDPTSLTSVGRLDYLDDGGRPLGFLQLYQGPGDMGPAYYAVTELTRVPVRVYEGLGDQLRQDIQQLL